MYTARTFRVLTTVGVTCSLLIAACGSDPTTTADSVAPTAPASTDAGARATSAPAPVTTKPAPSTPPTTAAPTTPVPTSGADVTMEEFQRDVAEICAPGVAALAALPPSDGTIETVQAQLAMLRDAAAGRMNAQDVAIPAALEPQMDEVLDLVAAGDAAFAESEAAAASGDGILAAETMERNLDISKQIAVKYAIMGASCGPVEAERAAAAAMNVPLEGNPEQIGVGFGSVWASELDADTVVRIDAETGEILARIPVGESPLKVQPADGRMWVRTADAFVRIDPKTNTIDATLLKADVGPAANRNFAVDGTMWVCDGHQLHRYDPTSLERSATIDLDIDCDYVQAWDDLVVAWIYNDDPSLSADPAAAMIDPATNQVLATIPLPVDVLMPVVFDDRVFFAGNFNATGVVIDRADWTISATPDLGRIAHGGGDRHGRRLDLHSDRRRLPERCGGRRRDDVRSRRHHRAARPERARGRRRRVTLGRQRAHWGRPALRPGRLTRSGRRRRRQALAARRGSTQSGRTKWQVYPAGYRSR